ncbi:MAG: hypothetical protein PHF56_05285 [Desulfuromonadaceae bacterium]|nr:hypothetical protein [Desulfuromonadaceae bacterium]
MSLAQLSPISVQGNSSQFNPQVAAYKNSPPAHAVNTAQKAVQASNTDTVTISSQALQMAGRNAAVEKESTKNVS